VAQKLGYFTFNLTLSPPPAKPYLWEAPRATLQFVRQGKLYLPSYTTKDSRTSQFRQLQIFDITGCSN